MTVRLSTLASIALSELGDAGHGGKWPWTTNHVFANSHCNTYRDALAHDIRIRYPLSPPTASDG